jgi:hypothetical protein
MLVEGEHGPSATPPTRCASPLRTQWLNFDTGTVPAGCLLHMQPGLFAMRTLYTASARFRADGRAHRRYEPLFTVIVMARRAKLDTLASFSYIVMHKSYASGLDSYESRTGRPRRQVTRTTCTCDLALAHAQAIGDGCTHMAGRGGITSVLAAEVR